MIISQCLNAIKPSDYLNQIHKMGNTLWSSHDKSKFPLTIHKTKKYGWRPDLPDSRDIYAKFSDTYIAHPSIDLRTLANEGGSKSFMPEIYNQNDLGSCASNAVLAVYMFDYNRLGLMPFTPSRMFLYFNDRVIENTIMYDMGSSIRNSIKILNRIGVCKDELCPYFVPFFNDQPSRDAYVDADSRKSVNYRRIQINIDYLTKALSSGFPVVFGFSVYESFESAKLARTGIMDMPSKAEKIMGGHVVVAVGYDSKSKYILVRNSWGTEWGQKGYFWMPFAFFNSRNCEDAWIIQKVPPKNPPKNLESVKPPAVEGDFDQPQRNTSPGHINVIKLPSDAGKASEAPSEAATQVTQVLQVIKNDVKDDDKSYYFKDGASQISEASEDDAKSGESLVAI